MMIIVKQYIPIKQNQFNTNKNGLNNIYLPQNVYITYTKIDARKKEKKRR